MQIILPCSFAERQQNRATGEEKTGKDQYQSTGLQPAEVRESHSMVKAGAGINSFLQKGQKAVATLLSSIMDSGLNDISKRVDPG